MLTIYAMKIVGDGSNQTKTAAQTIPYLNDKDKGRPNFDGPAAERDGRRSRAQGWPVSIHCNGDETLDIALDAIEDAYGAFPTPASTGSSIARSPGPSRSSGWPSSACSRVSHEPCLFLRRRLSRSVFGAERAARMDPAADCVRLGLPFTIHTDAPCSNIGTLQLVQAAVTRKCSVDGSIVGPEQAVSLTDALRAVTIHAAGQIGMADQLGTLESGKLADFTILEKDPYKVDPDALMNIKVSQTWVGGQKKYG